MTTAQRCWHCGHPYLSQLQQDIMTALVDDPRLKNAELARRCNYPEATIRNRLTEMYAVLGVRGRIGLVLYAQKMLRSGRAA